MACRLTLNPGESPFPYGPLVLATYTQSLTKIDIQFDPSVDKVVLEHSGTQVTSVNDIINFIAKESNYASDSVKVCGALSSLIWIFIKHTGIDFSVTSRYPTGNYIFP